MQDADIVFMPYNYMLDPTTRQNFKIDISRSIVIFDEAHNLGQCAEQNQSFEMTEKQLIMCHINLNAFASRRKELKA